MLIIALVTVSPDFYEAAFLVSSLIQVFRAVLDALFETDTLSMVGVMHVGLSIDRLGRD
jgi:hypothetical protein